MNFDLLEDAIPRYAPVMQLDSGEMVKPVNIEWFLNHGVLINNNHSDPEAAVHVMREEGIAQQYLRYASEDKSIYLPKPYRYGNWSTRQILAPVYYRLQILSDSVAHVKFIMLWPYNPNLDVCGGLTKAGGHQADIEHITMEFVLPNPDERVVPRRVFLSSHGSGKWYDWADMRLSDERLLVCVSKSSHAFMPMAGSKRRIFGTVKDVCDARGSVWRPERAHLVRITSHTLWNQFKGHLGWPGRVNVPAMQSWWDKEQEQSDTFWSRIFLCDLFKIKGHPAA